MSVNEGIAQLVVLEEEHRELLSIIARIQAESSSRAVLLIGSSGQLIAEWGDTAGLDMTSFCTLCASNIAATAILAKLVGDEDFTILFHQGKKDSIHISLIGERLILAVIFGKDASLGIVRLRVKKAAAGIQTVIDRVLQRMKLEDRLDLNPLCEITEEDIEDLFSF